MASISKNHRGHRVIQFKGITGKRQTIRLGDMPARLVKQLCERVESLLHAQATATAIDADMLNWLDSTSDKLHAKLVRAGLVSPRISMQLGSFLDSYIAMRTDVKPNSTKNYRQAARYLREFFGENAHLREINPLDAERFNIHMKSNFAAATATRILKFAKQFWDYAVRSGVIQKDIWSNIKGGAMTNADRQEFVSREMIARVIEQCPDAEWRLIVALSRFGGVRVPSEVLALQWTDILWDQDRFTVRSSKTGTRVVPLFPELLPFLRECFELASEGAVHVIAKHRNASYRTRMFKIVERAGLVPWPKLFNNLRSSRETELCDSFPEHVVAKWIGNSKATARAHYNQVTDKHYQRAVSESDAKSDVSETKTREQIGTLANTKKPENVEKDKQSAPMFANVNMPKKVEIHPEGVELSGSRLAILDFENFLTHNPTHDEFKLLDREQLLALHVRAHVSGDIE